MEMCTNALKNIGGLSDNSEIVELPDWCKVGEWVWSNDSYHKIVRIKTNGCSAPVIILDDGNKYTFGSLSWDDISQASPRPYNKKEMKALVGKVVDKKDGDAFVVTAYTPELDSRKLSAVSIDDMWVTPDAVLEYFTINGKPCGVFEHLNDNGEWVK